MDSELKDWLYLMLKNIWEQIRIQAGYDGEMKIEKLFFDELNIFLQVPRE